MKLSIDMRDLEAPDANEPLDRTALYARSPLGVGSMDWPLAEEKLDEFMCRVCGGDKFSARDACSAIEQRDAGASLQRVLVTPEVWVFTIVGWASHTPGS